MYSTNIYSVSGKLFSTLNFGHADSIAIYNSRDTVVSGSYAIWILEMQVSFYILL